MTSPPCLCVKVGRNLTGAVGGGCAMTSEVAVSGAFLLHRWVCISVCFSTGAPIHFFLHRCWAKLVGLL
jgi:hypothetical protein